MTERKLQRNRRGFTLTEVLLALAILIILLALAMIPISRHQRNIRQSELDSKAETIYLAAQNRLSQLQASGRSDEYGKDRATALNNIPWDAEQDKYTTSTLYYVTSAAKSTDTSAAGSILPREQVEAELWDANWVIEYDPGSGSVYAVFYSEKPMQYSFDAFNPLRSRDRRVQEGATVGYYGGDSVQSEDTGKLTPKMEIINKERLLLKVTCDTPRDPLHFYVTVTDAQGHSTGRMELTGSEVNVSYRTYTVTMVLDDRPRQRQCLRRVLQRKAHAVQLRRLQPPALTGSPGTGGGYRGLLRRRQRPERGHRQADPQDGDHQQGASAAEGHL